MRTYKHRDFSGHLDVVTSVLVQASADELKAQDQVIVAFREALKIGVPIAELSAETGLPVEKIRALAARNLTFGEDLASLAGITR